MTVWRTLMLVKVCALVLLGTRVSAQTESIPFSVERSSIVEIQSEVLGRDYNLYVRLPRSYNPASSRKYPIVFLLDADYSFPLASSLDRQLANSGRIEDLILVGVSYSKGDPADVSRTRDYTPTHSPKESIGHSAEAKLASGHAGAFLEFMRTELLPFVAREFRADMSRTALAGHSFGGLFASFVLAKAPGTFRYYIVSDPSLWYDNAVVLKMMESSQAASISDVLIVGANSDPAAPAGPQNMVGNERTLAGLLRKRLGSGHVELLLFDGEIHESVFPIAVTRGFRRFYAK